MSSDQVSILLVNKKPIYHAKGKYLNHYEYMMDNFGPFKRESWRFPGALEDVNDAAGLSADSEWHAGEIYPGFDLYDKDGNPFDYRIFDVDEGWFAENIQLYDVAKSVKEYCLANNIEVSENTQELFDSVG